SVDSRNWRRPSELTSGFIRARPGSASGRRSSMIEEKSASVILHRAHPSRCSCSSITSSGVTSPRAARLHSFSKRSCLGIDCLLCGRNYFFTVWLMHEFTELTHSAVVTVSDAVKAVASALGNVMHTQPLEVHQLQNASLRGVERCEHLSHQAP